MNEATEATPKPAKRVQVAVTTTKNPVSRLVSRSKTRDEAKRKLAGKYRVIHGRISLARPTEEWQRADGTEIPNEPKQLFAEMGDIVELTDDDAARMLDLDIVEHLDAKPSRMGKVKAPDAMPFRNQNA